MSFSFAYVRLTNGVIHFWENPVVITDKVAEFLCFQAVLVIWRLLQSCQVELQFYGLKNFN
jgi:hypothetical protein